MQVTFTCRHGSADAESQAYITRKAEKLLTFFERVTQIDVTADIEKQCRVEILVDAEHKHNFVSHHEADGLVPAFDQALHKMEQQIRKYKEKLQDHRRDVPMNELAGDGSAAEAAEQD